jgi:hypothetical protein
MFDIFGIQTFLASVWASLLDGNWTSQELFFFFTIIVPVSAIIVMLIAMLVWMFVRSVWERNAWRFMM